jgi:hypothetical protein
LATPSLQLPEETISAEGLRKQRLQEKSFLAEYVPITADRLVVVSDSPHEENQLRPVANDHRE